MILIVPTLHEHLRGSFCNTHDYDVCALVTHALTSVAAIRTTLLYYIIDLHGVAYSSIHSWNIAEWATQYKRVLLLNMNCHSRYGSLQIDLTWIVYAIRFEGWPISHRVPRALTHACLRIYWRPLVTRSALDCNKIVYAVVNTRRRRRRTYVELKLKQRVSQQQKSLCENRLVLTVERYDSIKF